MSFRRICVSDITAQSILLTAWSDCDDRICVGNKSSDLVLTGPRTLNKLMKVVDRPLLMLQAFGLIVDTINYLKPIMGVKVMVEVQDASKSKTVAALVRNVTC
jgi:hypothetical protein